MFIFYRAIDRLVERVRGREKERGRKGGKKGLNALRSRSEPRGVIGSERGKYRWNRSKKSEERETARC